MRIRERIGYVLGQMMGVTFYLLLFAIVLAGIKVAILLIRYCIGR